MDTARLDRFASAREDVAAHASYRGLRALREMHAEGNGAFGDMPATTKPFKVRGVSGGEVDSAGKATVRYDYLDRLDSMSQVGLASEPGQS